MTRPAKPQTGGIWSKAWRVVELLGVPGFLLSAIATARGWDKAIIATVNEASFWDRAGSVLAHPVTLSCTALLSGITIGLKARPWMSWKRKPVSDREVALVALGNKMMREAYRQSRLIVVNAQDFATLDSLYISARKYGIPTPPIDIRAGPGANSMTDLYLTAVGTRLANGHFDEAVKAADDLVRQFPPD